MRTCSVSADGATVEPPILLAVTDTRTVELMSSSTRVYVSWPAPSTSEHVPSTQRCHWYAKDVGALDQAPGLAVTLSPSSRIPETVGLEMLTGAPAIVSENEAVPAL